VQGEYRVFGAVGVVGLLVVFADYREGVHDVVGVIAAEAVEVEEGGVELAAELEAALGVPAERGPSQPTSWAKGSRSHVV